jgi:hypothetical protein
MFVADPKMIGFWAALSVKVVDCTGLTGGVCANAAPGTQTPTATTTEATESATPDALPNRRACLEVRAARPPPSAIAAEREAILKTFRSLCAC